MNTFLEKSDLVYTIDIMEFSSEKGIDLAEGEVGRALLVGVYQGGAQLPICEEHLGELEDLADTFGVDTVAKMPCSLRRIDSATYLQSGKVEEVRLRVLELGVNLVIMDEEISPAQQRNLEKILKVSVMDRTELILEIFAQRAETKEAKLQVELARTKYEFPRLKRLWSHFSRQRASGGFLKGEGEKQIEIDRRLLNTKLEKLQRDLKQVKKYRETQSERRRKQGIPTFALVGYTNAGKSTLLNALTDAEVFTEDKLFATLDPTTRKCLLSNNQEVLLSDTVGFVRKLPHTVVAAFRSTLEAAMLDDVLLHVIDASHPMAEEHANTTFELLKELKVRHDAILTVLNKVDLCPNRQMIDRLRIKYSKTVLVSASKKEGLEDLKDLMLKELQSRRKLIEVMIPQKEYSLVTRLHREGTVVLEEYEGEGVLVKAEVPLEHLHIFSPYEVKHE